MNLIQTLNDELRQKHLNDFEKARYIYLRCCEIFSFDARWYFNDVLDDEDMHNRILNKNFDIKNIDSQLVICHSFAIHILKPLIDELTNLNCETCRTLSHSFVLVHGDKSCHGLDWKLDATLGDLARVKLELPTRGFDCGIAKYDTLIDDIDIDLGFCNLNKEDYERRTVGDSYTKCIENVSKILENSKAKYHYSDATYLFDMLALMYSNDNRTYLDEDYNFHRLIEVPSEYSFFDLSKQGEEYKLKRIRSDEYKELTKTLYYK